MREGVFRCAFFVVVAALNPLVFAVYWITLRASIGVAGFMFHHLLHNRRGALGTYALPFPPWLARAGGALFGAEPMLILTQHRSHHLWPDVRVRDLPRFPAEFALPPDPSRRRRSPPPRGAALPPRDRRHQGKLDGYDLPSPDARRTSPTARCSRASSCSPGTRCTSYACRPKSS
jgi:hypothetical protein